MKKLLRFGLFTIAILFLASTMQAQELLFTSSYGGDYDNGAIVSYNLDNNNLSTFASLEGDFYPSYDISLDLSLGDYVAGSGGLTMSNDGYSYGIEENYSIFGSYSAGFFYRINNQTGKKELLHTFSGPGSNRGNDHASLSAYNYELSEPCFKVYEKEPGIFYGIAKTGGIEDEGGIWKYNINTHMYSKVGDFQANTTGIQPVSQLVEGPNNTLYGLLRRKKNGDKYDNTGYLYKIETTSDALSYENDLGAAGWAISKPVGKMVYLSSTNKIYGTKHNFAGGNYGGGVFSYNLSTKATTNETLISYDETDVLGSNAEGMIRANDGKLYFLCVNGGSKDKGTLVAYSPSGNTMIKLIDFSFNPQGAELHSMGTKLYGTYQNRTNNPAIWEYDILNGALSTLLMNTSDDNPGHTMKFHMAVGNGIIVGKMLNGGSGEGGSFFKIDTSSNNMTVLEKNNSETGRGLRGEITLLDNTKAITYVAMGGKIYNASDVNEQGGIAEINLKNKTVNYNPLFGEAIFKPFITSYNFTSFAAQKNSNGLYVIPRYLLNSSGGRGYIKAFSETDPASITLATFSKSRGYYAEPVEYEKGKYVTPMDTTLYMYDTTTKTSSKIQPTWDWSKYGSFTDGYCLASDNMIYGISKHTYNLNRMYDNQKLTIYSIDPNTWQITVHYVFEPEVVYANIRLTEVNGKLYGSTVSGGTYDEGYLFAYDMQNESVQKLYDFEAHLDGGGFEAGWTYYKGKLYSTSYTAGAHGYGTLVEYDISNDAFKVLAHLTLKNGRGYRATPIVWDENLVGIDTPHSEKATAFIYYDAGKDAVKARNTTAEFIRIYASDGKLLKVVSNQQNCDMSSFNPGIYFVNAKINAKTYRTKICKP